MLVGRLRSTRFYSNFYRQPLVAHLPGLFTAPRYQTPPLSYSSNIYPQTARIHLYEERIYSPAMLHFLIRRLGSSLLPSVVPSIHTGYTNLRPTRLLHIPCRAKTQFTASMGRAIGSKVEQAPNTSTIPILAPPPTLRKLAFNKNRVCTEDGTPILEGVSTQAWRTTSPESDFLVLGVETSDGASTSLADFPLGVLRCKRWLACARNKLWWMTPEWGTKGSDLPPETQFLLMELDSGEYVIMLPLIDNDTFRGTLRPPR